MADVNVKHAFVSPKADNPDSSLMSASKWNAAEIFSGGSEGDVVRRRAASATGASWEAALGDVVGPASSVDNEITLFSGITGKLLKRAAGTGFVKAVAGV